MSAYTSHYRTAYALANDNLCFIQQPPALIP